MLVFSLFFSIYKLIEARDVSRLQCNEGKTRITFIFRLNKKINKIEEINKNKQSVELN